MQSALLRQPTKSGNSPGLLHLQLDTTSAMSLDYIAFVPCAVWVNILSNCSENCQLVFLLSLVGRHRKTASEIAKQLWPARIGTWAAQCELRRASVRPRSRSISFTRYHLELTTAQALQVARMHLLKVQLSILHDSRLATGSRRVSKGTVHVSNYSSEPISPIVFSTCLCQLSKALWARWSVPDSEVHSRSVLWSFGDWHGLIVIVRYVMFVDLLL